MPKVRRSSKAMAAGERRSACPIACALDLIGDRWTLLVVRDLFRGLARYGEFLASPEGIPTNLLAERLQRLEAAGVVAKTPYQRNPVRHTYALTPRGQALKPVLGALAQWSMKHVADAKPDPELKALLGG